MFLSCLVGTPVHSSGTQVNAHSRRRPKRPPPPGDHTVPVPIRLHTIRRRKRHRRSTWVGQFLVRPESHPEPRGFLFFPGVCTVWADPVRGGQSPASKPSARPPPRFRPRLRESTLYRACRHGPMQRERETKSESVSKQWHWQCHLHYFYLIRYLLTIQSSAGEGRVPTSSACTYSQVPVRAGFPPLVI